MTDTLGPWGICDRSGFKVRQSDMVTEWTGLRVAKRFAEQRHPQDFVKGRKEDVTVKNARPDSDPVFLEVGDVTAADL